MPHMMKYKALWYGAGIAALTFWTNDAAANSNDSLPPAFTGYYDNVHQVEYLFYMDYSGFVDQLSHDASGWHFAAVTSATSPSGAAYIPGSQLLSYFDGSIGHLFYIGGSGTAGCDSVSGGLHLVELKGSPPSASSATDITVSSGVTAGGMPAATPKTATRWRSCPPGGSCVDMPGIEIPTTLTGFHDSFGGNHVFYAACDFTVNEAYTSGSQWFGHSIGGAPGSATFGQNLASCWDGSQEHVYFMNATTRQLTFPVNSQWAESGVPGTKLSGFLTTMCNSTEQALSGIGQDDQNNTASILFEQFSTFSQDRSVEPPLLDPSFPTLTYANEPCPFSVGSDFDVFCFGDGVNLDLSDFVGGPAAANWVDVNMSDEVGASPLVGFNDGSFSHLFYIGSDSQIHEFYIAANASTPFSPSSWFVGSPMGGLSAPLAGN